jgi:hypothetical protein
MDAALDALIGEELEALGEELSMFLEPTCECVPTPRSRADRQPTRKKRKKQKRKPQVARREDNQEVSRLTRKL